MMKRLLLGMSVAILATSSLMGSFWEKLTNPEVVVNISHPPSLGLQLKKIAFGPAMGQCADPFIDSLVQLFVDNQVEVVDRQHLESILAEHKFNLSGYVDPKSAASLGKILGPAALVFIKISRCETKKDSLYSDYKSKYGYRRIHISRTKASFKGSLQAVDLATGRIFTAKTFEASPQAENKSEGGQPEFPDENMMLDQAMAQAKIEIHRMFFPWFESVKLTYFNDKACGMKQAYAMLKRGDIEGALQRSLSGIEEGKNDPNLKKKELGRVYYNAGMSYFTVNDYDRALDMLNQSAMLHPGKIVDEAIITCNHAKKLAIGMQQFEQRMQLEEARISASDSGSDKSAASASAEERLKKLNSLFKKGLIDKKEYEKKKADVLKEF